MAQNVTNAVLAEKIDALSKRLEGVEEIPEIMSKIRIDVATNRTRLDGHREEIKSLRGRINNWGSANSLGAVIAAITGIFVNPNK